MPLPPAPSKKAARLNTDYVDNAPKASKPKTPAKPAARVNPAPVQATARAEPVTPGTTQAPARQQTASAKPALTAAPASALNQGQGHSKPSAQASQAKAKRNTSHKHNKRLFVLDTNVLMHDPICMFRFEEHDIFLPMVVLEELDNNKKGMSEVARNARQTSRTLDALAGDKADMMQGLPLNSTGHKNATGKLFFQTAPLNAQLPTSLPQGKADNQILGVVQALSDKEKNREVVLVSKDINMRVKARALGLAAEDYENDKTLDDGELLYPGMLALPADFWSRQSKKVESWQEGSNTFYRIGGAIVQQFFINQFVYFEAPGEPSLYARVVELRDNTAVLRTLRDFAHQKNAAWGVTSRNREQNFALNLLMDPEVDFITLTGTAGTGKTLLALASGLTQVLDERRYTEIIMTRATVSVGEDIGFLPGTEEEKMGPWMGALDDNLEFLAKGDGTGAGEWGRAATNELIRSRIKVKSLNFMRGRTFLNKYVIIDEAQNLTPKQMKTLITRAGPGTKIICMGNLAQIDTPYLSEGSSGLTYVVDRFKGWTNGGHITLARGERSRLADFASDVL
ncbi:PhoH family protein [Comamonadaceae bacterium M7527]|nr:PhoH family protein [Comamonadaceae bacterium M7527]